MNFLALSQAPPELAEAVAMDTPETRAPGNNPAIAIGPMTNPTMKGVKITRAPGAIISFRDSSVEIVMHLSKSGLTPELGSLMAGFSLNYLLISITIMLAALPTAYMHMAEKAYGSIAPTNTPEKTNGEMISTFVIGCLFYGLDDLVKKAPYKARETRAADPIANPFPMAAVQFPAASRASVLSLVSLGSLHISAIPPALSETGPYESIASPTAKLDNIPRAASATPNIPINI